MTLHNITGTVPFKVEGQNALPKWQQQAIRNALAVQEAPPESLRFQCRIASDARENFKRINLPSGEILNLHPKAKPQFGKNKKGLPYLTVTLAYSGDGKSYTFTWEGDAVPEKMQRVAVKHDKGLSVRPVTVDLDLGLASVKPAWTRGRASQQVKNPDVQRAARERYQQKVAEGRHTKKSRHCARLTDSDLAAAKVEEAAS